MSFQARSEFDARQLMNKNIRLRKFNEALIELAKGCEEHPQNRFQRSPKSECERCAELFALAEQWRLWT